jgi:hypothetical protein
VEFADVLPAQTVSEARIAQTTTRVPTDSSSSSGSLEFVGRFEEHGWKLAGAIVPITYIAWSLWLMLSG